MSDLIERLREFARTDAAIALDPTRRDSDE
jgi:hypothetical protein